MTYGIGKIRIDGKIESVFSLSDTVFGLMKKLHSKLSL